MVQTIIEEIEEYLKKLPSEMERDYEIGISKLAEKCISDDYINALTKIMENNIDYSYEAFVCLSILYRRNKDFELMKQLIDNHPEFEKRISYNHIIVQYHVHSESFYDYDKLLEMAYNDTQTFSNNAGYFQAFCNAFATICECCNKEDSKKIVNEWYDKAVESINRAIELDPGYAKFYCTKGRILSFKNRFTESISLINQAVAKENSKRPDYELTILNYQMCKMSVLLKQQENEFEHKLRALELRLKDSDSGKGESLNYTNLDVYKGTLPYAFISYAHKDQVEVYDIISKMQNYNTRIWFDKGLEIGGEWPEEIANRLLDSSVVLVMLSTNSLQSANVRREVNLALSENKKLIAIHLDDVDLSPGMKLQFGMYQMIFKKQYSENDFINVLVDAVQGKLGG